MSSPGENSLSALLDERRTFPPSEQVRDMIENIHEPEAAGPAVVIETAPEH